MAGTPDITRILKEGSGAAELLPLVYEHLHALARARMAGERVDHTLSPTALVHEAYLRLVGDRDIAWAGRGQFFHAAAEAMRRILIDHARKYGAAKRGGDWVRSAKNVEDLAAGGPDGIVAMDEAFVRFEAVDPRAAEVVRLRFYAGLTVEEAAAALGISVRSVMRDWEYARAWLLEAVAGGNG